MRHHADTVICDSNEGSRLAVSVLGDECNEEPVISNDSVISASTAAPESTAHYKQ